MLNASRRCIIIKILHIIFLLNYKHTENAELSRIFFAIHAIWFFLYVSLFFQWQNTRRRTWRLMSSALYKHALCYRHALTVNAVIVSQFSSATPFAVVWLFKWDVYVSGAHTNMWIHKLHCRYKRRKSLEVYRVTLTYTATFKAYTRSTHTFYSFLMSVPTLCCCCFHSIWRLSHTYKRHSHFSV